MISGVCHYFYGIYIEYITDLKSLGWTSPDGREFGAVGQADGTAFVEIKEHGLLEYKGRIPTQTEVSSWRSLKVAHGYVYIGSEAPGHGIQVFDMRKVSLLLLSHRLFLSTLMTDNSIKAP